MPTAAKFVASVFFAGLAWYVTGLIIPLFPEGTNMGWFRELNALIGLICGWRIAGPRGGTGWNAAISYGLTTMVAMTVSGLFFSSAGLMLEKSLRSLYDGPTEAIVAVFELMVEHGLMMADGTILGTLAVGGIVGGLVTEAVGRNFS